MMMMLYHMFMTTFLLLPSIISSTPSTSSFPSASTAKSLFESSSTPTSTSILKSDWSCNSIKGSTCTPCPNLMGASSECPGTTLHRIQVDCTNIDIPRGTVASKDGTKWFASCAVPALIDQKRQDVSGVLRFQLVIFCICFASSVYVCIRRRKRNEQTYTAISQ